MSGKLLIETIESAEFVTEEVDGKKHYFIEGDFIQTEKPNRNNRIYKFDHMSRVVESYRKNFINENRAWGELNHPDNPTINLERVSHLITKLEPNGTNFWGKAKIVDTPMGNTVKGLLDGGGKLGVSTRGVGSLKPHGGYHIVQEDFQLATAGDIVANPSAQSAFVSALMENQEWLFENGKWHAVEYDRAKKIIRLAPKRQIEEVGLKLLEDFIKKI